MITNNNNITEWAMLIEALLPLLLEECKTDLGLRHQMQREDKSMEECAKYVYNKAREIAKGQKCAVLSDQKTLELAIEYFTNTNEEDDERDTDNNAD